MNTEPFYQSLVEILALPSRQRHSQLCDLHTRLFTAYGAAIAGLAAEKVGAPVADHGDPRTLAQVVGHIAAWDRFMIQGASDILGGVSHPRAVATVEGFIDQEGQVHNFTGVDEFNAYFAQEQAQLAWPALQQEALDAATVLHALFTQPDLLTSERLDHTKPWRKRFPNGHIVENSTMGWVLWIIALEHYGGEHAAELDMQMV